MEAVAKCKAPVETYPKNGRIEVANDGAHQASLVLAQALDDLQGDCPTDDEIILRALVTRALTLVRATCALLSYDEAEGETMVEKSLKEVRRG